MYNVDIKSFLVSIFAMCNYVSIDLGTTTCKCRLYTPEGVVASFAREFDLFAEGYRAEQNANDWWTMVKMGITSVCGEAGVRKVDAIGISSQGISVVPVDSAGTPLMNALSWLDNRATAETSEIEREFGADWIFANTGKRLLPCYTLPKVIWLMRHRHDVMGKANALLMPLDFLNMKFCGRSATDCSMASGTMLYDINKREWSEEILSRFSIPRTLLPEVLPMGTDLGAMLPDLAEELGLETGARIVMGGQDQKLSNLAAGLRQGMATVSLGTSTAVSVIDGSKRDDRRFALFALNAKEQIQEAAVSTTGAAVRWLKNTIAAPSYAAMDTLAEEAGSSGGVTFNHDFEDGASISGISLGTTKGNIVYALLESVGRTIADLLDGQDVQKVLLYGGGAKSPIWRHIIERAVGVATEVPDETEPALLGAAMLAAGGAEAFTGGGVFLKGHEDNAYGRHIAY